MWKDVCAAVAATPLLILFCGCYLPFPPTFIRKTKSSWQKLVFESKPNSLHWSSLSNTHWLVILPGNSVPRHSASLSCGFFAPLIDRRNQHEAAAAVLITDPGSCYNESLLTTITNSALLMLDRPFRIDSLWSSLKNVDKDYRLLSTIPIRKVLSTSMISSDHFSSDSTWRIVSKDVLKRSLSEPHHPPHLLVQTPFPSHYHKSLARPREFFYLLSSWF